MRKQLHPVTLTDTMRKLTNNIMARVGMFLHRLGIHPDMLTIAGLGLVMVACGFILSGHLQVGALILFIGLPFDALDGAVARAMQRQDRFGELLDSSLDRYADAFIFASLGYYFAVQSRFDLLVLAFFALVGSYGVSYVRARAEGIGIIVKVGFFSRMERVAMILVMLFVPDLLQIGMWILAIGTNLTTVQRLWYVYKTINNREV